MKKILKKPLGWLTLGLVLAVLWPAGVMAETTPTGSDNGQLQINSITEIPVLEDTSDISDQVVVIYKESSTQNAQSLGLSTSEVWAGKRVSDQVDVLEVNQGVDMDGFIDTLNENPSVLAADRNRIARKSTALPNDPYISNGMAWQFADIGEDQTWNQVANSDAVVVAVLDTGVNSSHPDLAGRMVSGYDYGTGSTRIIDHEGHGTSVSGCIAAVANNGLGIAGVAGTANVKIASYCIGDYSDANICAALMACANRADVDIINMSYGGYDWIRTEAAAIKYASAQGKILVASAGNEGNKAEAGQYSYPASYDNVISVAATNSSDARAYFSQYNDKVDLAAPGQNIVTTTMNGSYESTSGTSFSAPIVAGACAVLLAENPALSASDVESILENTALDLGRAGKDNDYGYGLIQLDQALTAAEPTTDIPLTGISLNRTSLSLSTGASQMLSVTCSPGNTTADTTVTWTSSNPAVATVSANGTVTAVSAGDATITARIGTLTDTCQVKVSQTIQTVSCFYQTHIQDIGWQSWVSNGQTSGTSGKSKRLEGIKIDLSSQGADLGVKYQTHIQNIGWQDWAADGTLSGTTARSLRLEAIRIELTGSDTDSYDIYYRVHAQDVGWMNWAKDGESAGTAGFARRLEAIQIVVVSKGTNPPTTDPRNDSNQAFIENV